MKVIANLIGLCMTIMIADGLRSPHSFLDWLQIFLIVASMGFTGLVFAVASIVPVTKTVIVEKI